MKNAAPLPPQSGADLPATRITSRRNGYLPEGEFRSEIAQEQFTLQPGAAVLGPRRVPHV